MLGIGKIRRRVVLLEQEAAGLRDALSSANAARDEAAESQRDAVSRIDRQQEAIDRLTSRLEEAEAALRDVRDRQSEHGDHLRGLRGEYQEGIVKGLGTRDAIGALDIALRGLSRRVDIDAEEAAKTATALVERIGFSRPQA